MALWLYIPFRRVSICGLYDRLVRVLCSWPFPIWLYLGKDMLSCTPPLKKVPLSRYVTVSCTMARPLMRLSSPFHVVYIVYTWGILKKERAAASAKSLQLCPTLRDPIDGSPPGSAVPGILQARTLEWVAISFSNAWKWKWSCSVVSDCSQPHGLQPTRLLRPMGFSRQWSGLPLPSPKERAQYFETGIFLPLYNLFIPYHNISLMFCFRAFYRLWRRRWQPIPVFLPGKFHGQRSLSGYSPWESQRVGHDWEANTN